MLFWFNQLPFCSIPFRFVLFRCILFPSGDFHFVQLHFISFRFFSFSCLIGALLLTLPFDYTCELAQPITAMKRNKRMHLPSHFVSQSVSPFHFFDVFLASRTYFIFTAAGVVPCGGRKTSQRNHNSALPGPLGSLGSF